MKKLNRKGFTLVELLAVIIILAIVVGITIPAILNTTSKAKEKAFSSAAETCADWVERQYQLYTIDSGTEGLNTTLKTSFGTLSSSKRYFNTTNSDVIEGCGLKTSNVKTIHTYVTTQGRVCILLEAQATDNSDYKGAGNVTFTSSTGLTSTSTSGGTNFAKGGACADSNIKFK